MILLGVEMAALVLGWLHAALAPSRTDLAGAGMANAYAIVGSGAALLLMVPAFALAYAGKLHWLALILAAVAAVFVLVAVVSGL